MTDLELNRALTAHIQSMADQALLELPKEPLRLTLGMRMKLHAADRKSQLRLQMIERVRARYAA